MKLNKAQEKRLNQQGFINSIYLNIEASEAEDIHNELKQHLADELAREKKEIIEKLEKLYQRTMLHPPEKVTSKGYIPRKIKCEYNDAIDQAIKTIKGGK